MSEQLKIYGRVRAFQKDMEGVEIIKATEAYGYYYATLPDILKVIVPILRKHKIWYQHVNQYDHQADDNFLYTYVYCEENFEDNIRVSTKIDKEATIAKMNQFMVLGSAITYFKRYHLTTVLDIVTDEDTDAGGKKVTAKKQGRSVESASAKETKIDFASVFTKQSKTKTKQQFMKTFDAYKPQMDKDDIEKVTAIMKEAYEKK